MCDEWLEHMDNGKLNGVIFLDIKKAFYSINHDILLNKMKMHFGIPSMFITVKIITILNLEHSDNFEKLAVVVHLLRTSQNLVISRCCFVEDGKEMYKEL